MNKPWLAHYPEGMATDVDPSVCPSLVSLFEDSFQRFADRPAVNFMDVDVRYGDIDRLSRAMAAWLQAQGLQKGDRVAVMLPNVPQYPVAVTAILRAGLVVVNVNPLYTARELEHQLKDSGAKVIVILENFAHVMQKVLPQVPTKKVILTSMGDLLGGFKGALVNFVVRRVKKLVPPFELPGAVRFKDMLSQGASQTLKAVDVGPDDIAVLQYTGGTTGVSKGAVLLHRNLVANVLQAVTWKAPVLKTIPASEQVTIVCALPLYHIFAFTFNLMMGMRLGACSLLIPNPRDIPATLKALTKRRFHIFPAVNTLFNALASHPDSRQVDWSSLVCSVGGGMTVHQATAKLWLETTGCPICEAYGLSETSPGASANPVLSKQFTGSIGMPLPGTEMAILDDAGQALAVGEVGEIAIRGPQVMAGYWHRPDETAKVMTADGYFRTGDVGVMDERGYFRIVDRKKDMILVSGFNVYPNEIEEVLTQLPGVAEAAAVGMPDDKAGEVVKVFVVKRDPALTEKQVMDWCAENLTGYKRPKVVEFRKELPKTPVGKVLRRELRQ